MSGEGKEAMPYTPEEIDELMAECQDAAEEQERSARDPYEEWDDPFADFPHVPDERVVVLAPDMYARFVDYPVFSLRVYRKGAREPLDLPYFDHRAIPEEELIRKLKGYVIMS